MDFTRNDVSRRLEMHILNLCLAAAAGKEGDIGLCRNNLLDEVEKMVREAKAN